MNRKTINATYKMHTHLSIHTCASTDMQVHPCPCVQYHNTFEALHLEGLCCNNTWELKITELPCCCMPGELLALQVLSEKELQEQQGKP